MRLVWREHFERSGWCQPRNRVLQLTIRQEQRRDAMAEDEMAENESFSRLTVVFAIAISIVVGLIAVSVLL